MPSKQPRQVKILCYTPKKKKAALAAVLDLVDLVQAYRYRELLRAQHMLEKRDAK